MMNCQYDKIRYNRNNNEMMILLLSLSSYLSSPEPEFYQISQSVSWALTVSGPGEEEEEEEEGPPPAPQQPAILSRAATSSWPHRLITFIKSYHNYWKFIYLVVKFPTTIIDYDLYWHIKSRRKIYLLVSVVHPVGNAVVVIVQPLNVVLYGLHCLFPGSGPSPGLRVVREECFDLIKLIFCGETRRHSLR